MSSFFIAIPTYDKKVDVEIALHLQKLPSYYPQHEFGLDFIATSLITDGRNYLVRRFLSSGADYLYFWDSDVIIRDLTFLEKLLETAKNLDADIVGGAYRFKHDGGLYVGGVVEDGWVVNFKKEDLSNPRLADCIGTGSMLISRKVLETMPDPWFSFVELPGKTIPEDFNFCKKAKEFGYKIAIDPRFSTQHFGYAFWEHSTLPATKDVVDPL